MLTLALCDQVTKSLLHKACTQSTDLYTFSIALMKIDKTMINYQNEVLQCPLSFKVVVAVLITVPSTHTHTEVEWADPATRGLLLLTSGSD